VADVTGFVYEAFVEFLLRRLRYRDEWTAGGGRQYLYEKHPEALCHRTLGICKHASECHAFSKQEAVPYGPWYDPDFFLLDDEKPVACIHVTHWSNPRSSQYKFWRTIEDHFEYKVNFGMDFLSLNLVFVALEAGEQPRRVVDSDKLISLHGWSPANGSMLAVSFDSSILFPLDYSPLEEFVAALPEKVPGNSRKRRKLSIEVWERLYKKNAVRNAIDHAASLLKKALAASPSPRYTLAAIGTLQDVCWHGRQRAIGLQPTETRYRKGLQHAFIVRELIARAFGSRIDSDGATWSILRSNPRFPWKSFRTMLGADTSISDVEVDAFRHQLASIPVQMDKRLPIYLLTGTAGLDHAEWNPDFKRFILGLRHLKPLDLSRFKMAVRDLFEGYRGTYGMDSVLADLSDSDRITRKVQYVQRRHIGLGDKATFVKVVAADMLTPGHNTPHQAVVKDVHNWPVDLLLEFYDLGSMQHITTSLPAKFLAKSEHSLRPYAYMNNLGQLVSHLIAGAPVGQYFSKGTQLDEAAFYKAIWPLFAECLWEAIGKRKPLDAATVEVKYRYKKAMRIISSPDLEPISFLLRRGLPALKDGPTLRGAFNQLSTGRRWSRAALTTETTGRDAGTGVVIQTQSVFGGKHISDKTRELAGRMRSLFLRCDQGDQFVAEPNPGVHFAVLDGDWPVDVKVNLLESGFSGLFEIAELATLTEALNAMAPQVNGNK